MNGPVSGESPTRSGAAERAELIRVRGLVQGVGFRPTVWRLAKRCGLRGSVANDGYGLSIRVCGPAEAIEALVQALVSEAPPLARIDRIERTAAAAEDGSDFRIVPSGRVEVHTGVVPDAAACPACLAETLDPASRRYRYPFTNCTACGPRLSIIEAIPYDRVSTTLRSFGMCPACAAEYEDPDDRRFHAQPIACPACGPRAWLEHPDGSAAQGAVEQALDALDAAGALVRQGHIVAVKGLGGFQLACDARSEAATARLRLLKRRERKPFALMARTVDSVRRYCTVGPMEEALLTSPAAPIVILDADGPERLASAVAPGVRTLGFMLPATPLHHLLLQGLDGPIVLTSGNRSEEPQCIGNEEARARLAGIADYFLMHDRGIARRVDDSVVRVAAGAPRILRRARGYAPAPLPLAAGFAAALPVLAMGAELKNAFALLREGAAVLSHHMGDLEDALTHADYRRSVEDYLQLFGHEPQIVAVDCHPDYLSSRLGRALARQRGLRLEEVQHHHAHIAACLAENGVGPEAGPVLGIALDGLGYGADGGLWGGELLLADYRGFERLAALKPVAMPGGVQAMREPWRNTYAHLVAALGRARFAQDCAGLDLHAFLEAKPHAVLDAMLARAVNAPPASSCGRLFDAVAAAAGVCRERAYYEGQAAVELEALAQAQVRAEPEGSGYPFGFVPGAAGVPAFIEPRPMWEALLADLRQGLPAAAIAARFHRGLAAALGELAGRLCRERGVAAVALSGGVFQNRLLMELLTRRLEAMDLHVLSHRQVPANDGGLALGQAAVAAARALAG